MDIDCIKPTGLESKISGLLGKDAKPQTKRIFGFICVVFMNMVFNYVGVDPFASLLDSLPFAGAIVAMMSITGIKYKEGYPPIAMTTMLFTLIGNILAVLLMTAFPMLP
ncbi:MAG: hypothetical protein PUA87_05425 [Oscillospiraceae bacterium]|nr:hypothetical protein [Oscillospiraceae bacterium]